MSCTETQELLSGYIDGELDLAKSLEVEQHMAQCDECSRVYKENQSLRSVLKEGPFYYEAPARLHTGIMKNIRNQAQGKSAARFRTWIWRGALAAVITAAILFRTRIMPQHTVDSMLADEIVASHIRSLMASHLTDVPSSDRHTVKPWFNGKLDFSPPVPDLSAKGFPIAGGRLDYFADRPVAAIVYQRRLHIINVFVWPADNLSDKPVQTSAERGYNIIHWSSAGKVFWIISDLASGELREFSEAFRAESI